MDYGEVLTFLKNLDNQNMIAERAGWNGKKMHIWLKRGSMDISKLNELLKNAYALVSGVPISLFEPGDNGTLTRLPCLCFLTAGGEILEGWLASQTDMLAEDWSVKPNAKIAVDE